MLLGRTLIIGCRQNSENPGCIRFKGLGGSSIELRILPCIVDFKLPIQCGGSTFASPNQNLFLAQFSKLEQVMNPRPQIHQGNGDIAYLWLRFPRGC